MSENKFKIFFIKLLGSWFFVGHAPIISGTFGTLLGLPLVFALSLFGIMYKIGFCILFMMMSIYISDLAEKIYGRKDDGRIVIDEVAGLLFASLFVTINLFNTILIFLLFRFFDIVKIYPAGKIQSLKGGYGVVLDDVVAGLQTGVLMWIITRLL